MERDKKNIIDRVRKALAKADESRNASTEEAATALRIAQRLMAENDIEMAEVLIEEDAGDPWEFGEGEFKMATGLYQWHQVLQAVCAHITGTRAVIRKNGRRRWIVFYGDTQDCKLAVEVFVCLLRQGRRAAKAAADSGLDRQSFNKGFAYALHTRAMEEYGEDEVSDADAHALVVIRKDSWLEEQMEALDLKTRRQTRGGDIDPTSYSAGQQEGARADFGVRDKLDV